MFENLIVRVTALVVMVELLAETIRPNLGVILILCATGFAGTVALLMALTDITFP